MKDFNAIIIDSDLGGRSRVKQAAVANNVFKEVIFSSDFKDALAKIETLGTIDVVFLASRFGRQPSLEFVRQAKSTSKGEDCAYILVLPQSDELQQMVASGVLEGVDGFLVDPFSADGVLETTHIAQRIKLENMEKRARTAIAIHAKTTRTIFRKLCYGRKLERKTSTQEKELKDIAAVIQGLSENNQAYYMKLLIEEFEKASPPPSVKYTGVSKRIKDKLEKKVQNEIKERLED